MNVPFEGELAAWLDWHACAIALGELVADDVDRAEAIGRYEPVVEVVCLPADSRGNRRLVLQSRVPSLVCHAIGDDFVDVSVGSDERRKREEEGEHRGVGCEGVGLTERVIGTEGAGQPPRIKQLLYLLPFFHEMF